MNKEKKEVPGLIVSLIGLIITFIGNFFPQDYPGRIAGTLLDLFGICLIIYGFFNAGKQKKIKTIKENRANNIPNT